MKQRLFCSKSLTVLRILIEFAVLRVVGGVIIPFIIITIFPNLPDNTSVFFAGNTVRIVSNVLTISLVLCFYKRQSSTNVWVWGDNGVRRFSSIYPSIGVLFGFLFKLIVFDRGVLTENLIMILQPMSSTALSTVITVPIAEELLYRGYLLRRLYDAIGKWPAIVLSSLIFGINHTSCVQATLIGLVLGLLYLPRNSASKNTLSTGYLGISIFLHMLINLKTI